MKQNKKNSSVSNPSFFTIVIRILGMAFTAGPVYLIVNNLMAVVNGASQGFITYMNQLFFDSVEKAITLNLGVKNVIMMAFALSITIIVRHIFNGLNNFMGISYFKKVTGYFSQKINIKASKIYPIAYENSELLDDINKASLGANNSLGLLFTITTVFSYYSPYFLFMFFYLYSLEPFLAISLIFVFIPVALSQILRNIVFAKLEDEIAPMRREYDYYKNCIGEKETRVLGAFGYFRGLLLGIITQLNKKTWKAERKAGLIELGLKTVTLLGYLGIIFLFVSALLKGKISIAAFSAIFASIDTMFVTMDVIICQHIANMTRELGTIKNFIRFLDMPEREGTDFKKDEHKGICLTNVSFRYPGAQTNALNNVSINLNRGETIAIVGENGSGKTTLVKLILGLYEPTDGSVEIFGLDTRKASLNSISAGVSAVFQKYQRYKLTLGENINISDLDRGSENFGIIDDTLDKVGLELGDPNFPEGYFTVLSREFDGVDLSGGQWQRVAIARGLYRIHDLIILDEPTAAIDPIEEANIYQKFTEISRGKTSIIVTHRLGSTKIADKILVMESGEIIEIGTHTELMAQKGKYYTMYSAQAKWYVK